MTIDESIIHLFNPEELEISHQLDNIHKEYSEMSNQLKKIGNRYNKVLNIYKPIKTKYLKKIRDIERKKRLKEQKEIEKIRENEIKNFETIKNKFIEQKKLNFKDNFSKFETSLNNLFKEKTLIRMNFGNETDIDEKIIKFSKTFREHCVHPECCKAIFTYEDWEEDGCGQGVRYFNRTVHGCTLCYTKTDVYTQYPLPEKFLIDKEKILYNNHNKYIDESIYLKEILNKKHLI